jgi:hypothetical protein
MEEDMATLEELEQQIEHLNFKLGLLMEMVGSQNDPFTYHCLEADLGKDQIQAILGLMDEVWNEAKKKGGKPMNHHEFEQRVYQIVPSHKGDYHFAEGIVSTLYDEGKYKEVFKHMKKDGMNIHDFKKKS